MCSPEAAIDKPRLTTKRKEPKDDVDLEGMENPFGS